MEADLDRITEREAKLQASRRKKEADLRLLDDEQDNFRVKVSQEDFELLKRIKQGQQIQPAAKSSYLPA